MFQTRKFIEILLPFLRVTYSKSPINAFIQYSKCPIIVFKKSHLRESPRCKWLTIRRNAFILEKS